MQPFDKIVILPMYQALTLRMNERFIALLGGLDTQKVKQIFYRQTSLELLALLMLKCTPQF